MEAGIRHWARHDPNRIALAFADGGKVTYAELESMANRFAHVFRSAGLATGAHVCGILPNGPEAVAVVWGAYRCGLYYTPVAHSFSGRELAYVVNNSDSRLVIASAQFAEKLDAIDRNCPALESKFILGTKAGWADGIRVLAAMPDTPVDHELPGALMMYSSGTTGAPKGIWRPLPNPEKVRDGYPPFAADLIDIFGLSSATRLLSPGPLYHASPLRWTLAVTAAGGCAVVMNRFDAASALDILQDQEITTSLWVPTMLHRINELPAERRAAVRAPAHQAAWHAAAKCAPSLKRAMIDWWGPIVNEFYSGSEGVGMTTITAGEWLDRPGSVGRARKGRPHVLDAAMREVATGRVGSIYFDTPSPFSYYNEPEKTARRTSAQGWQTLGDIGRIDEAGYLFLTDRQDDMIISGGVNIYPQEIEQVVDTLPDVAESCTVAIPDADLGERPVLFVVPKDRAIADDQLITLVREGCQRELGRTKQPYQVRIVAELPRSDAGKLLRRILRDDLAREMAQLEKETTA